MKNFLIAPFLFIFFVAGAYAQTEGIVWETDFKKAQQEARASGKPLLLDFTAPWCKPCQMMDREFWVRDDVIQAAKPFIAVKVDFDAKKNLVDRYKVSAIPFVAFTDPLGNMVTFRRGFSKKNASELSAIFEEMPKDFSPMLKFYDALDLKEDDGDALYRIASAYRGAKMFQLSNEFYKKAQKTPEIKADAEKMANTYLSLGVNYLLLKDYSKAVDVTEEFLKTNPTGQNRETALYFMTLAHAYNRKFKNADKFLQTLKAEFPTSSNIAKAEAAVEKTKSQPEEKE